MFRHEKEAPDERLMKDIREVFGLPPDPPRFLESMIFPAIPKPDPLGDEVDADETNHGPCAQGDCSDE